MCICILQPETSFRTCHVHIVSYNLKKANPNPNHDLKDLMWTHIVVSHCGFTLWFHIVSQDPDSWWFHIVCLAPYNQKQASAHAMSTLCPRHDLKPQDMMWTTTWRRLTPTMI